MASEILETLTGIISSGLKRKSLVDCATWAEKCRVMGNPFPGNYSFKYHPWAREMHNADCEEWVGQKAAQMGFTEIALNTVFYYIDIKRMDCLYLLPSQHPDASQFSAGRFDPALSASSYLASMFSDVNNVSHKRAGGTNLFIRGTRSRASLKSVPVSLIVFDELDEMTQKNLSLADERQSGQMERRRIKISTPTVAGTGINFFFERSTQEHFYFKCPSCSKFIELIFPDNLVVTADHLGDENVSNSYIQCNLCKAKLDHRTKFEWLADGVWQPTFAGRSRRGFYVNQLYSSTESPGKIAQAVLLAQEDESAEQELYNSKMGKVHEVKGARVLEEEIQKCLGSHTNRPKLTDASPLITMGVDQGSEIHYEIDEWTPIRTTNHSIDLNYKFRPRVVDHGTVKNWSDLDVLMRRWQVKGCVVDAHPEKRNALEFAYRFDGLVKLCIYAEGVSGKNINVWSTEPTVSVDRTAWLDLSFGRFHTGNIVLPINITDEYKKHIRAMVRKPEKDKYGNAIARYVIGLRVADHFAHARNYAEIALNFAVNSVNNQLIAKVP